MIIFMNPHNQAPKFVNRHTQNDNASNFIPMHHHTYIWKQTVIGPCCNNSIIYSTWVVAIGKDKVQPTLIKRQCITLHHTDVLGGCSNKRGRRGTWVLRWIYTFISLFTMMQIFFVFLNILFLYLYIDKTKLHALFTFYLYFFVLEFNRGKPIWEKISDD